MATTSHALAKGITFGLLTPLAGAIAAAFVKQVSQDVSIHTIIFVQNIICMLILLPWLFRRRFRPLRTGNFKLHLIRGISGWLTFTAFYLAIKHISLAEGSLLRNSAPLYVPLLLWIVYRVKIPPLRWLPLGIGFIGISLILRPQNTGFQIWHVIGFCSAVTFAISMVVTRMLARNEDSQPIVFYYSAISAMLSLPFALLDQWNDPVTHIQALTLLAIGISVYLAMTLYTKAFTYAKASVVAPLTYFGIVYAGVLDWLIWQHTQDWVTLAGILLVMSGGVLSFIFGREKVAST